MALQIVDQAGAPGALLLQPVELVGACVRVVVNPVGVRVERLDVPRLAAGESPNGDAAHPIGSFAVHVRPGHVVTRAAGEHVDLVGRGEPLGDEPAQMLRPAENFRAVPLDDEREFHDNVWTSALSSRVMRASPKSASRRRCPASTFARRSSSNANAPSSSAASSRSFGANCTPAPSSVSGTAAAA